MIYTHMTFAFKVVICLILAVKVKTCYFPKMVKLSHLYHCSQLKNIGIVIAQSDPCLELH
jgi:hypothetical protein